MNESKTGRCLTCNRLDLESLGSWPTIYAQKLPVHCSKKVWRLVSAVNYPSPALPNYIHPKLRNINLHNMTHSLISRNPREWMFVVQISLLISWNLSLIQPTKEVNPHPRIAQRVNMGSVTFFFFFFFFLCHLLNVGACICDIAWEGRVECTTPHH
jgi:hypothetical protein